MQERPRFRTDLVAHPVTEAGQRFVDVTDPDSGSTFRFYEVEYAVACAMNGQRDYDGLAKWSHTELGLEPSRNELETVVSTLDELGYLAGVGGADVMLGEAGKSPISSPRQAVSAPDVELGRAGASEDIDAYDYEADTQIAAVEEPEVSVDLSQHLSVGADDVKEAVRQSRVMEAAVPEEDEAATEVKSEPLAASAVEATAAAIAAEVRKEEKKESAGARPITIPAKTPAVKGPTPAEMAVAALPKPEGDELKKPGSGGMVAVILVLLVIVAVAGYFVYTQVLNKEGASSEVQPAPASAPAAPVVEKKKFSRLS